MKWIGKHHTKSQLELNFANSADTAQLENKREENLS